LGGYIRSLGLNRFNGFPAAVERPVDPAREETVETVFHFSFFGATPN
jgi:hypothetical protein